MAIGMRTSAARCHGGGRIAIALLLLSTAATGCMTARLGDGLVVEPERVAEATKPSGLRAEKTVVVLDVRPLDQFRAGHLRGAHWLDLTTWSRLSRAPGKGFADQTGWEKRIGELGIAADDRVLVYDGGEMTEAARIWYILQLFGLKNVAVLNGGSPALRVAAEESIVRGEPPRVTPKVFQPPRNSWPWARNEPDAKLASKSTMRGAIAGGDVKIVDARTRAEFEGRDARHNPRVGHLPGAVNIPHMELLDERGRLRSADELRKVFSDAGLEPGEAIVAHCQSGGRSALAALAAKRAGYADVSNYYMSFGEWAQDETCPLADADGSEPRISADEQK